MYELPCVLQSITACGPNSEVFSNEYANAIVQHENSRKPESCESSKPGEEPRKRNNGLLLATENKA